MNKPVMPELPGAIAKLKVFTIGGIRECWRQPVEHVYDATQMHAYARQHAAALEARLREVEAKHAEWLSTLNKAGWRNRGHLCRCRTACESVATSIATLEPRNG